ncbi:MAG TPA: L-seryl-tRNA(Sec) selenium transferase [Vicinamibacterales bacterium]|nr:L-seryl-tRNA(Sec) selenium transferase [Vicinamibacterales bacterium]
MASVRDIPSIESLLQRDAMRAAVARHGRDAVIRAARQAADEFRVTLAASGAAPAGDVAGALESRAIALAGSYADRSLRRVVNATGVVIHTNLGRAPLAAAALTNARLAEGYSNLEYDLARGERGHRHVHAERLLRVLTGAQAALVANNTAAAALLALAALASGREVIVSRGELVEIGGGFRVPDVLAQSGAQLREVGTTNRTRLTDYAAVIGPRTALILRVHPSNFRMTGFTDRPDLAELVGLARQFSVPIVEDLGSGWLGAEEIARNDAAGALSGEPVIRTSLETGADLVLFSGDKLLGGPQAGIVVGRRPLIEKLRAHPLMRALRVDKLTYAALEATLALWVDSPSRPQIPLYRMLTATADALDPRARSLAGRLQQIAGVRAEVIDSVSTIGGGSAPGAELPTKAIALRVDGLSAAALEQQLRAAATPVIARIETDTVILDLRTIDEREFDDVADAVRAQRS